jgi:DNA-binding NarL/FixJ family response regulator
MFDSLASQLLASGPIRIGERSAHAMLTPSQLIVLVAAANGLTAAETARMLRRGTQTVKTQRGQTLLKLGARNMAHAVHIAVTVGVITRAPAGQTTRPVVLAHDGTGCRAA